MRDDPDIKGMIEYLTRYAFPRRVFRYLQPDQKAPTTPTGLAQEVLDITQQSMQGWFKSGVVPPDKLDRISVIYGFESTIWEAWNTGNRSVFENAYKTYWGKRLAKLERSTPERVVSKTTKAAGTSNAFRWDPPTPKDLILKRLNEMYLEKAAGGDPDAPGLLVLASDEVAFAALATQEADTNSRREFECVRHPEQRPRCPDVELAAIEFPRPTRNEMSLPWPLSLDFDFGVSEYDLRVAEAEVAFHFSASARISEMGERRKFPGTLELVRPGGQPVKSGVRLTPRGPSMAPRYDLVVSRPPLGGMTARNLIELYDLSDGETVKVRVVVSLRGLVDDSETAGGDS
ncbi:MAG: hypothetical protein AAGB04_06455 [Pseudomonadota bacterium]